MGSDKDNKEYVPRFNKTSLQYEDNTIYISFNPFDENLAKNNITFDTPIKIKFSDKYEITITKNPDVYSIKNLQNKFHKYIAKNELEELKKIKIFYMSYYMNVLGKNDFDVLDDKEEYNNIIESLRKTLSDNRFSMNEELEIKIVNKYLCDFMGILGFESDIEEIIKYESPMVESTRETSTQEVSKGSLIPTLSGEDNSHDEQNEPTQTRQVGLSETQAKPPEYVFDNVAIHQHETNLIYGDSGVCKSLFSIAIGNSDKIKYGLYFLVDNYSEKDVARYNEALDGKAIIIGLETIADKVQEIKKCRKNDAQFAANVQICNYYPKNHSNYFMTQAILNRCYKLFGAELDTPKPVNVITAVEAIIDDAISNEKIDFICLDSLNGLAGDSKKITRDILRQIIQVPAKNNITFLCIHHPKSGGKDIAGTHATLEVFDNIYRLLLDTSYPRESDDEMILFLVEEKARHSSPRSTKLKAIFENNMNPTFEVVEELNPSAQKSTQIHTIHKAPYSNLTEEIKAIINGHDSDTMTRDELKSKIVIVDDKPTPQSITNVLIDLGKLGLIQMNKPHSWDRFTIHKE